MQADPTVGLDLDAPGSYRRGPLAPEMLVMWSIYNQTSILPDLGIHAPRVRHAPGPCALVNVTRKSARAYLNPTFVAPKSQAAPALLSPALGALYQPMSLDHVRHLAETLGRSLSKASLASHISGSLRPSRQLLDGAHAMLDDILTGLPDYTSQHPCFAALQRQRTLLLTLNRHGAPLKPASGAPIDAARPAAIATHKARAFAAPLLAPLGPPCPIVPAFVRALELEAATLHGARAHQKIRALITGEGRRYLISPPLARGQAKRFCVGITQDGAPVAVWQFLPHICVAHIQVELANLKRLCPDIEVRDLISAEHSVFAIVTLLDGGSAAAAMADVDAMIGPVIAHHVMAQTAAQLAAMHAHGFVHGDVKPDNILFGSRGQLVLSDFDLARPLDLQHEAPTHHAGTYLAPEVWMQTKIGPAIDVWSWAASAGDLYLGAKCNPHRYMSQGKSRIDARASRRETWSFLHWRARLFDARGHFKPGRISQDTSVWSRYYIQLYNVAPVVTLFALRYGLEGDPTKRISAQAAQAFYHLLCQADHKGHLDGAQALRALAPKSNIALWTQHLERTRLEIDAGPHRQGYRSNR